MTARSEPGFFLMSHGQDRYHLAVDPIARDVAAIPETDQPLSILFREILDPSAHPRMDTKLLKALNDDRAGSLSRRRIVRTKKRAQALKIAKRRRSEDYSWHSGAGRSFSSPQLDNHCSTSSAVT